MSGAVRRLDHGGVGGFGKHRQRRLEPVAISLACRSSRFSRSRAFILAVMSVDAPGRLPESTPALFTQSLSVCPVQPILGAIDRIVAQRDGCSCSCSRTRRTARLRTSGENCSSSCSWRLHLLRSWSLWQTRAVHYDLTDITLPGDV
jgi:hypothetical protein